MASAHRYWEGFTLIELMVTLAVLLVLTLMAYPSFEAVRQRAAVRGVADEVLSFWNQARLEAAKRNLPVKVGVVAAGTFPCLGATTTAPTNGTACDCAETDTADADFCDVARFPTDQGQWRSASLVSTSTFGTGGVAVIEAKRTSLVSSADAGNITINGPQGRKAYRLNVHIDPFGRGVLCQSSASGIEPLSGFNNRQCAD